jgi:hypothetical protein
MFISPFGEDSPDGDVMLILLRARENWFLRWVAWFCKIFGGTPPLYPKVCKVFQRNNLGLDFRG